jgi:protein-tyrosine phosphatase
VQALFPAWEEKICFWSIKDLGEGDPEVDPISALEKKLNSLLEELS